MSCNIKSYHFIGRSVDANGSDITLLNPEKQLIANGHFFHVMLGHLILEVVSMHPVKEYETASIRFAPMPGLSNDCENRGAQIANESLCIQKWLLRERERE